MFQYSFVDSQTSELERFLAELPPESGIEVKLAETKETKVRNIVFWCEHNRGRRLLLLRCAPRLESSFENILYFERVLSPTEFASGILGTDRVMLTDRRESPERSTYTITAEEYVRIERWLSLTSAAA